MKKLKQLLVLGCCIVSIQANCQFYGQIYYGHDSTLLSSAELTRRSQGYVMSGYRGLTQGINNNNDFVVDKVDASGNFGGLTEFSNGYYYKDNISCAAPVRPFNCNGVMTIETNNHGHNEWYALAGSYNNGVFFATLGKGGNVIRSFRWNIAVGSKRPRICESRANPGYFYICCADYVMCVNCNPVNPVQVWCQQYASGFSMWLRDVIENPVATGEVVVVGQCDPGIPYPNSTATDGVFLRVASGTGNVIALTTYNRMWDGDDWFTCIEPATCTDADGNPCQGEDQRGAFVLGGRSHFPYQQANCTCTRTNNKKMTQWMCKLDGLGNVIWSTLIEPYQSSSYTTGGYAGGEISDVHERLNPNTSLLEYYGVAWGHIVPDVSGPTYAVAENLECYKLDIGGGLSLSPDEFHYTLGEAPPWNYSQGIFSTAELTAIETGGGADDGIQVYGSELANQNHYFTKGYFNGVTGCNEIIVDIDSVHAGPSAIVNPTYTSTRFTPSCPYNFQLTWGGLNTSPNQQCYSTTGVTGGSNARPVINGISAQAPLDNGLKVYPNPTSGKAVVELGTSGGDATIQVFNALGQRVKLITVNAEQGARQAEIDFDGMNVNGGMYFIDVTIDKRTSHSAIMYNKE